MPKASRVRTTGTGRGELLRCPPRCAPCLRVPWAALRWVWWPARNSTQPRSRFHACLPKGHAPHSLQAIDNKQEPRAPSSGESESTLKNRLSPRFFRGTFAQ
jgi:hypothetical protein